MECDIGRPDLEVLDPPDMHNSGHTHEQLHEIEKDTPLSQKPEVKHSNSTRPTFKYEYNFFDASPYVVHISAMDSKTDYLHPLTLGKILYEKLPTNSIQSIKRLGSNRLAIYFGLYTEANRFLKSDILSSLKLKAQIPYNNLFIKGIARNIVTKMSEQEIKDNAKTEEKYEIVHVHRFQRKVTSQDGVVSYVPSTTCVLTFRSQRLPRCVRIFYSQFPVQKYNERALQCSKCSKFGHSQKICRNTPKCLKCADNHEKEKCTSQIKKCANCSADNHSASDKKCPLYQEELILTAMMSERRITRFEAYHIRHEEQTYAQVTSHPPDRSQEVLNKGQSNKVNTHLPDPVKAHPTPHRIPVSQPSPTLQSSRPTSSSVKRKERSPIQDDAPKSKKQPQKEKPFWHIHNRETSPPFVGFQFKTNNDSQGKTMELETASTPQYCMIESQIYKQVIQNLTHMLESTTKSTREQLQLQITSLKKALSVD